MGTIVQLIFTEYCGKYPLSRKEIAAVLSRLEREGEIRSPNDVLNHQRWDSLTTVLAHHAMSAQKGAELKTWGLLLGALRVAREDKNATGVAHLLLGIGTDTGEDLSRFQRSPNQEDPGEGRAVGREGRGRCRWQLHKENRNTTDHIYWIRKTAGWQVIGSPFFSFRRTTGGSTSVSGCTTAATVVSFVTKFAHYSGGG